MCTPLIVVSSWLPIKMESPPAAGVPAAAAVAAGAARAGAGASEAGAGVLHHDVLPQA